ncbi:MAG: hypothetical protein LBH54_04940 [Clostridiales bacterium]|jgi:F0F1-type ATP synthase membrane subunit b/b'|nr:hypothetical protein [Clostridiales bacterium]
MSLEILTNLKDAEKQAEALLAKAREDAEALLAKARDEAKLRAEEQARTLEEALARRICEAEDEANAQARDEAREVAARCAALRERAARHMTEAAALITANLTEKAKNSLGRV